MTDREIDSVLTPDERATFLLRKIYAGAGYSRYRMSKFEEYDLYMRNKDFLVSDGIITFTDTDGRLLALKPDVTLSIIKNSRPEDGVRKLFYDEKVYRVSGSTKSFREIMQVGLECIGEVGATEIREVLSLAKESLEALSPEYVLEIAELDIASAVLDHYGLADAQRAAITEELSRKNAGGVLDVCRAAGLSDEACKSVALLVDAYGKPERVLRMLDGLKLDERCEAAIDALSEAVSGLSGNLTVDLSLTANTKYYNGVAFVGFIRGVPTAILRGGQYDKLAEWVSGRREGAIGFAIYLDELEKLSREANV